MGPGTPSSTDRPRRQRPQIGAAARCECVRPSSHYRDDSTRAVHLRARCGRWYLSATLPGSAGSRTWCEEGEQGAAVGDAEASAGSRAGAGGIRAMGAGGDVAETQLGQRWRRSIQTGWGSRLSLCPLAWASRAIRAADHLRLLAGLGLPAFPCWTTLRFPGPPPTRKNGRNGSPSAMDRGRTRCEGAGRFPKSASYCRGMNLAWRCRGSADPRESVRT